MFEDSDGRIKVGVLRGGPSSEYEVSLKSGQAVLRNLPEERFAPADIFIDRAGAWHILGEPRPPHKIFPRVGMFFNALHGQYGEDGEVSRLFDHHGVPYTGSRHLPSRLAMNKALAKSILKRAGIKTPHYRILRKGAAGNSLEDLFTTFPMPAVVKPLGLGSSVGTGIAGTREELAEALTHAFAHSPQALIEEYIKGEEATCGVIEHFRGEDYYALPPAQIRPPEKAKFFDYEAKYGGESEEICPGNFAKQEIRELQELARMAHRELGLRHYSRSDFIVHPRRGIYFLEANTLPGLTEESLFPKALTAVGTSLPEFLEHTVSLALEGR